VDHAIGRLPRTWENGSGNHEQKYDKEGLRAPQHATTIKFPGLKDAAAAAGTDELKMRRSRPTKTPRRTIFI